MNKGITLFGKNFKLEQYWLELQKKSALTLKNLVQLDFFYIYLKKKWKGLTNVFLKLILILVLTLQSSSIIFLNSTVYTPVHEGVVEILRDVSGRVDQAVDVCVSEQL